MESRPNPGCLATLIGALLLTASALPLHAQSDSVVVFNEIQFHPLSDEGQNEWIELHNQMSMDVDLSGWELTGGVDYIFPEGTLIQGRGYLVIASDLAGFAAQSGATNVLGPWSGRLDNGGERLRLRNNSRRIMDELDYGDSGRWPVAPDGSGATLSKTNPDSLSDRPENWQASHQINGTPGARNFPRKTTVRVTTRETIMPIDTVWRYEQSNTDLGAAWREPEYDDSAWDSGPALLGVESTPLAEPLQTPMSLGPLTFYFRTSFNYTGDVANASLSVTHIVDDGMVLYLNGVEVWRVGMDTGTPAFDTLANRAIDNATYEGPFSIPSNALMPGNNVLAAEVHQWSADSSDFVLGVQLDEVTIVEQTDAGTGFPDGLSSNADLNGAWTSAVNSTSEVVRASLAFNELPSIGTGSFWIEIMNYGDTEVALEGHTIAKQGGGDASYVFPSISLPPGSYFQVPEALLGFSPEEGSRLFLFAPGRTSVLDAVVATVGPRARYPDGTGPWMAPSQASPAGPNLVTLRDEIVINEIMYQHQGIPGRDATYGPTNTLIQITDPWRYHQDNVDLGTAWKEPEYDDANWPTGDALFYATPATLPASKNTPLSLTDGGGARKTTFYFRTEFAFAGDPSTAVMLLRHVLDDGAVIYLNGEEILRVNMPLGEITFESLATANVGIAEFSEHIQLPTEHLIQGNNILAVEVHQVNAFSGDVVFGAELAVSTGLTPATPFRESPESWVELFNRGTAPVDLTGWRFDRGIEYSFPEGTILEAGGYLVLAKDVSVMTERFPGIRVLGPFDQDLSGSSDHLVLEDALGNVADEVEYFDGPPWPVEANGGGASVELRDPRADNAAPEAWAPSQEGSKSAWQTVTYTGIASSGVSPPAIYHEFVMGLLDEGEVLVDDISVIENPSTTPAQLIQNGSFTSGLNEWRIIGNHAGAVIEDPDQPGNAVLLLKATGPTEHMHNHAETTVKNGGANVSLVDGREYEISFRVKWLSGSRLFNTRLWFNRLARTTQLPVPERNGTPGAANSRFAPNIGPTFTELAHEPPIPLGGQEIKVTATVRDPDGLASAALYWSVDGGDWASVSMTAAGDRYEGVLPGASEGSVIQFYVHAEDQQGASAHYPAGGPDSRALIAVEDGQAILGLANNLRLIMTPGDVDRLLAATNLMSNGRLGGTVVYNESEVTYDVGIRLKGSEHGRPDPNRLGFNFRFPADRLFRGVHQTVAVDRSGGWRFGTTFGQDEILIKHIVNAAGNHTSIYDDLIRVIAPDSRHTGSAILQLARFGDVFLESQYPDDPGATTFEYELVYGLSATTGGPEGLKIPQEGGVAGVPIADLGDDKELYRHYFIIKNNRDADDYTKLIASAKALGLPAGAQFHLETSRQLDVDQWLRAYALSCLAGPGDNYWANAQHNLQLATFPGERRTQYLIFDTDFAFILSPTSPIDLNNDLRKFLSLPANRHLYYGHLLDIMNTTFNPGYMAYWTEHYESFLPGQNFTAILSYIQSRETYVRNRLPTPEPFEITTNQGEDFNVSTPDVALSGAAWIDVKEVRLANHPEPLPFAWSDEGRWTITVPLLLGTNHLTLHGIGFQGEIAASDTIMVTTSSPSGGLDSDGDGIPDFWELENNLFVDFADGSSDYDFDGLTNYEEYLAGTDPYDPASYLYIDSLRNDAGTMKLIFRAESGRGYAVQYRDALGSGNWETLATVPASAEAGNAEVVDDSGTHVNRFYRLTTPPSP